QPYGKVCTVAHAAGVLGSTDTLPAITCVNDPAIARHAVTVNVAPAVAAIPDAMVALTTEEGVQERSAFGATQLTFADVLFDSGTNLPVFKWQVTATSGTGTQRNNCNVTGGTNVRLDEAGQDATVPPSGPVDDVQVTL